MIEVTEKGAILTVDNARGYFPEAFIISAVEKQIPKKPEYEGDGYNDNGQLVYDTAYCPNCHHDFEIDYDETDYCPNCGQALDWSDEK